MRTPSNGKRKLSAWLSANDRDHWARRKKLTSYFRETARNRAEELGLPRLERARVLYWLSYGSNRRLDPHNYNLTAKAIIDGFVDYGLLPDDNSRCLIGPDPRRDEGLAVGMTMQIIPLGVE